MTTYPLCALRALALHSQELDQPNGSEPPPSLDSVFETVERLGGVQIDTLQMVARAHYVTLWSRRGAYDPSTLDALTCPPTEARRLFEGWYHAACFLPLSEYRYQLPQQRALRESGAHRWYSEWITQPGNRELMDAALARIRTEGAVRASDFEGDGKRGAWWDWKPAKMALEHMFAFGQVMIAGRVKFQRAYDLPERVLPAWVDTTEPTPEERDRFWLERGARALGVSLPRNPADYSMIRLGRARPFMAQLLKEGVLAEIQGETLDGVKTLVVHRDNLELLEKAASGEISARRTTFLNPFDNLWWAAGRDEAFWGFRQRLEAYTPAPKRVYGYFCLPILHKDRLVGRFDPKLERKNGLLRLKALHLEPGIAPDEELAADMAVAMRDFMAFHGAKDLLIEKSQPGEFGELLLSNL
jgi:hypothetical protein